MSETLWTCARCGITDAKVLNLDTGSECHPELSQCIAALRARLGRIAELERTRINRNHPNDPIQCFVEYVRADELDAILREAEGSDETT